MIIPSRTPSEDHEPPPYQESQRLPSERPPTSSFYAPPVSSRSNPPREGELVPDLDEATETTSLVPPSLPPKEKEKGGEKDPSIWDSKAPASASPDPASASYTPAQDPLNPAPEAFTRPSAKDYEYSPFEPMTMLGISSNLADGFPMIPPPINIIDERNMDKGPDPQHPFVSHDVTEDDWLKFLAGLKAVASTPNQGQRSFLARVFLGEMNEKEQRKRAIHFINSWNHYFFQPRRITVVLARGRKVFGSGDHSQRRHSVSGRDSDSTQTKDRRRSLSTDSTSSRLSPRSTVSEPREMPVAQTKEPSCEGAPTKASSSTPDQWWKMDVPGAVRGGVKDVRDGIYDGLRNLQYGVNLGLDNLNQGLNEGFYHVNTGLQSAIGGPSTGSQTPGDPSQPPADGDSKEARKAQQDAWKLQQDALKQERKAGQKGGERGMKPERKLSREASNDEKQERKPEEKGKSRDQPWKLIIFPHGARRETGDV